MSEYEFQLSQVPSKGVDHSKPLSNDSQRSYPRDLQQNSDDVLNLPNNLTSTFMVHLESGTNSDINEGIGMGRGVIPPTNRSLQPFNITETNYPDGNRGLKLPQQSEFLQKNISKPFSSSPSEEYSGSGSKNNSKSPPGFLLQGFTNPDHFPNPISKPSHQGTNEIYNKLFAKICELRPQNYGLFLLENLREWSHDLSLEEFYHLLYNPNSVHSVPSANPKNLKVGGSHINHGSRRYSYEVCSFIIDTFKSSCNGISSFSLGSSQNSSLSTVIFEDFLKTFLALKIIFDSIQEVDPSLQPHHTLPRRSIYDAYCMTCKNLGKKYQKDSKSSKIQSNTTVGVPHFGRLTKLVYPNLKLKRLGPRSNSKYHYLGITWKNPIVGLETMKTSEVRIKSPHIGTSPKDNYLEKTFETEPPKIVKLDLPQVIKPHFLSRVQGMPNSTYSFVRPSSKFPKLKFMPRVWDLSPGKVPENSPWSRDIISKSMLALQRYGVDMQPIIQNINCEIFHPVSPNVFLAYSIERMNILINSLSNREGYMHFYLIILLLLFPIILSSDTEVCLEDKEKLRKNLIWFVEQLKTGLPDLPIHERGHFINFSNIIRKMVHINELTSSQVETRLTKGIAEEITVDFQKKIRSESDNCEITVVEDIVKRAVIISSNAFKTAFAPDDTQNSTTENKDFTGNIIKAFVKFALIGSEILLKISKSMISQEIDTTYFDLPFQKFRHSAHLFHKICLSDPFVSKLPIQVINCISLFIHNEMHRVSFDNSSKRNHELSKNTFKTWWVYSTLAQEYMQILSEIVGLSETLS